MIKEILNVLQVPISASVFGHLAPLAVFLTAAPGAETHVTIFKKSPAFSWSWEVLQSFKVSPLS